MMEVPVLKTWIHSVFMDALETALVDPGRLHINVSGNKMNPGVNNWVASAQGVLSISVSTSQLGLNISNNCQFDSKKRIIVKVACFQVPEMVIRTGLFSRWEISITGPHHSRKTGMTHHHFSLNLYRLIN